MYHVWIWCEADFFFLEWINGHVKRTEQNNNNNNSNRSHTQILLSILFNMVSLNPQYTVAPCDSIFLLFPFDSILFSVFFFVIAYSIYSPVLNESQAEWSFRFKTANVLKARTMWIMDIGEASWFREWNSPSNEIRPIYRPMRCYFIQSI